MQGVADITGEEERLQTFRRNLALVMLFIVGAINFLDRQLLSVLVEPIRAELHFTDTQFGLLTGLAFALFYAAMGVPTAMIADRWNRIRLIGICCMIWSAFTAATGMVSNIWQLTLMRFGVGAGEAGGTAPSLSVIADYFPPERRAFAIGLLTCNSPFGVFLGVSFGAWAAANIGWRNAFVVVGLIGLVVAPLLIWLVREPERGRMDRHEQAADPVPLSQNLAIFIRIPSLRWAMIASALASFVSYGMLNWIPAFLMRTQNMPLEALATWYAPAAGITFALGQFGGGWLVSRLSRKSARAYGLIPAIGSLFLAPTFVAALLAESWQFSLALMLMPMAACILFVAPALALAQNLAPLRSRATAVAVMMLMFSVVGLGLGALFVGIASDALKPEFGNDSLRYALIALMGFAVAAAIAQMAMMRHLDRDLAQ